MANFYGPSDSSFVNLPSVTSITAANNPIIEVHGKSFSDAKRKSLAKSGKAMPDGSFPIVTSEDLHDAVQSIGRAKNPSAAKAHIKKRAKALGMTVSWKKSISAGGPGSGPQPSIIKRNRTEMAVRSHGFKLTAKDAKSSTFEKDNSKPWHQQVDKARHQHVVTVNNDGSWAHSTKAGQRTPDTGGHAIAFHSIVGPKVAEKVSTIRQLSPEEKLSISQKLGHASADNGKKNRTGMLTCAACGEPIELCECPKDKVTKSLMSKASKKKKVKANNPYGQLGDPMIAAKLKQPKKMGDNKGPGKPGTADDYLDLGTTGGYIEGKKKKIHADFGSDEERNAFFAKTVGGHSDASAIHDDMGDYHTQQAAKLSTSKSPAATKIAAAHTAAATAHYAASEAHSDAASDFTKANTATAQASSKKAFGLSDKVASMPKPKSLKVA